MSEILYNWLNNEVKLSKEITDIEVDFSNGYLFAELLFKYKQLPGLEKFKNTELHKHKVNNFTFLDKKFKDLKIRLSPEEFKDLIESKKNLAKQVLYRIKMQLSKREINFDNIMLKNSNLLHSLYKKINFPKIDMRGKVEKRELNSNSINLNEKNDPEGYLKKIVDLKSGAGLGQGYLGSHGANLMSLSGSFTKLPNIKQSSKTLNL